MHYMKFLLDGKAMNLLQFMKILYQGNELIGIMYDGLIFSKNAID